MATSRMAEQIGRVLGGRYRLLAPIGRGASAQVFVADDVRLRRQVAIKILHDALADDQEFLRRFRAEAQAAAALNHPHVMAVYDWGQDDDDVPWIVTEYLGGGSLRALLDRGHRLTPSQALVVGLQAAKGLDYAHRRGFVHRDIKPANLLFDDDGRLRIADFGLARALAEAAWTEPQGAVVGTARYASPEQAQGTALTGRADVYSLALVLAEAVTGEVPFAADTTLGTLMARVGKPLVPSPALGPLAEPVAGAGHPDPDDRLDARALVAALSRVATELPRPGPLPLAGATDVAVGGDRDPTDLARSGGRGDDLEIPAFVQAGAGPAAGSDPGAGPSDDGEGAGDPLPLGLLAEPPGDDDPDDDVTTFDPTWAAGGAGLGSPWARPGPVDGGTGAEPAPDDRTVVAPAGGPGGAATAVVAPPADDGPDLFDAADDDEWDDDEPWDPRSPIGRRRRRWPFVVLAVLLLAGAGVGAGLLVSDLAEGPPVHLVPTVTDLSEDAARANLTQLGFRVDVERIRRDGTEDGDVLGTRPTTGTELEEGELVTLIVSEGPTEVDLPPVEPGMEREEAENLLRFSGLVPVVAEERHDEDAPDGVVLEVLGAPPARIEKGTEVELVVSLGPAPRTVPAGLVGGAEDDVVAALAEVGLVAVVDGRFSDDAPAGTVMATDPGPGTEGVPRGSEVTVVVSRGPDLVTVPDVSGAGSLAEAVALLRDAGLASGEARGPAAGSPAGTSPAAGERIRRGSEVDILLQ